VSPGLLHQVSWQKFANVLEVLAASIITILLMVAASTFQILMNFYETTWCNNSEDSLFRFGVNFMKSETTTFFIFSFTSQIKYSVDITRSQILQLH
jgi:SUMO ligase MMS21 Smc5/6 complex component